MQTGDLVPDFALPDDTGTVRRLSELLAAGPVVLFFYPAAMTAGCTKESCHFRDLQAEFSAVGAQLVGISADPVDKQAAFSAKHAFGYPLLADPDKVVAGQMGVGRGLLGLSPLKRTTFVIDDDHRVLARIEGELRMHRHADEALAALRARAATRP
jgi:peroxiredoxin Q/BCP